MTITYWKLMVGALLALACLDATQVVLLARARAVRSQTEALLDRVQATLADPACHLRAMRRPGEIGL